MIYKGAAQPPGQCQYLNNVILCLSYPSWVAVGTTWERGLELIPKHGGTHACLTMLSPFVRISRNGIEDHTETL